MPAIAQEFRPHAAGPGGCMLSIAEILFRGSLWLFAMGLQVMSLVLTDGEMQSIGQMFAPGVWSRS